MLSAMKIRKNFQGRKNWKCFSDFPLKVFFQIVPVYFYFRHEKSDEKQKKYLDWTSRWRAWENLKKVEQKQSWKLSIFLSPKWISSFSTHKVMSSGKVAARTRAELHLSCVMLHIIKFMLGLTLLPECTFNLSFKPRMKTDWCHGDVVQLHKTSRGRERLHEHYDGGRTCSLVEIQTYN